ncbi:MAG: pyridoxamine 5'-phosphate oxidase family protein [Stomatobaculum sp.]|nr:pyridoxamine 5'-phosphate oxidase family protein [Stomatobaculum sp.]
MSKALEFIRECGCYFLLTMNGDFPAGRPFGAIIEVGEYLYIATNDRNETHRQLRENGNIQILAKKDGTREWLRITGEATECFDRDLKQRFLDERTALQKHYTSADDPHYLVFRVKILKTEFK